MPHAKRVSMSCAASWIPTAGSSAGGARGSAPRASAWRGTWLNWCAPLAAGVRFEAGGQRTVIAERRRPADGPSCATFTTRTPKRSEEHTSELQSHSDLVCRLLLEKKKKKSQ